MIETRTLDLPVILPAGIDACGRCVNRLRDSLLQIDGVQSVEVDTEASTMTLAYDPHMVHFDEVATKAGLIGVELRDRFEHKTLELVGLDCPDCALKLEKGVGRLNGVIWVSTNFATSKISIEYEADMVSLEQICGRVREMGYSVRNAACARTETARLETHGPGRWQFSKQTVLTTVAGLALLIGYIFHILHIEPVSKSLFVLAAVAGGLYAARGAFFSLKSFVFDMNLLMTTAAIGAIALGNYFDAGMVMFLFSLGNALEARSVERTRQSVRSLVNLFPTQARVKRDGQEIEIPASEVQVGDVFIVRPGEKIPTDGRVEAGSSTVNQASITGESAPVEKQPGDTVFAGTINQRGSIDAVATATAQDNTLARIVHLVEEAQAEKAPTQRFTEVFGRIYTPVVIGLAILVAIGFPFVFGMSFVKSVYIALTLLVVSCPCALVISTPVSIVSAIGNAARNGVLVKGGSHLEAAAEIRVVAFDKTGTLTTGETRVTDIIPEIGFDSERVLALAAAVESRSEHPLAEAIRQEAVRRGIAVPDAADFEALTGMGAAAKFDGDTCVIGNSRLMEQLGIDISGRESALKDFQAQGKTVVMVAAGRTLAGMIGLMDTVRDSARDTFIELRRVGIQRIVMITGDNEAAAQSVARDLGVDEYYAELLPQDKVDIVRVLIERFGSRVAVIGDGVNDAPALAAATVGIAMGAAGSPTAIETADIALMSDDLGRLPYSIRLSRKSLSTIKQNIAFSLVVIALLVTMALLGKLNLSVGVLGHEGSALIVIANGMRLLRFK